MDTNEFVTLILEYGVFLDKAIFVVSYFNVDLQSDKTFMRSTAVHIANCVFKQ